MFHMQTPIFQLVFTHFSPSDIIVGNSNLEVEARVSVSVKVQKRTHVYLLTDIELWTLLIAKGDLHRHLERFELFLGGKTGSLGVSIERFGFFHGRKKTFGVNRNLG